MWTTKTRKPNNRRFSYLLLGDGDHYIQDWIASCRPGLVGPGNQKPAQQRRLKGQLRLCSRAIFFEPDYVQAPILMFPFSKIRAIERLPESLASPSALNSKWRNNSLEGFQLKTSLLVKMKENGVDAPYVFEKEDSIWWFSLEFSRVQSFLQQAQPLLAINALSFAERDMILQNAAAQREAQAQFDTSRLLDLSEQVLLDCPAAQVQWFTSSPFQSQCFLTA
jgi:factor associated with neutral sphingomyelinase activation